MRRRFLLFLLGNILFISLVIAIYGFGYEYDTAYKMYPEMKQVSYDVVMGVYGERWSRLAKSMLVIAMIADLTILMIWYRNNREESQPAILD